MRARRASSVLVLFGVVACHHDAQPIVLAAAAPWHLDYALGARQGIELATSELNAAGGIHGRPLEIRWADDGASGHGAVAAAELLVADRDVLGVIGHVNSDAMLAASRIYDGQLVAVSPAATSPDLTGISPWVFRVITSDSANGATVAHFASDALRARQAAVLYENDAYGRGLARAFRAQFTGSVSLVAPIAADPGHASYEPYVTALTRLHPDVVFVAGLVPSGTAILHEAKRQHVTAAFLGSDGWAGINVDTADAENAYIATPFANSEPRPIVRQFVAAFEARYHTMPEQDAALAYDATRMLAAAIAAAGPHRRAIRDYLATLDARHAFVGVTGAYHFLDTGDPADHPFVVARVHRGALIVTPRS
ncbi:MAG TPA: ABC transporter substrate-binding protein [Gemmatimonadaceae bacterium]|jgi:branched-chain amino acid transport system substrate-binding protein|nr:ABC transporter substrate-binding protein [Gemmatimonadaceae bacterium]